MPKIKNSGCCGSVHAKIFEIILIISFFCGVAFLTANLVLTMDIFKNIVIVFFGEIGIIALNLICLIFSIILRIWRSNGSVLKKKYSPSRIFSIIIIILIIINLLCSLGEDAIFILFYLLITQVDSFNNDKEKSVSIIPINFDLPETDSKQKTTIYKFLPLISTSLNICVQILSLVFIILLIKRIKKKSDYGVTSDILIQNMQPSSIQNQVPTSKDPNLGLTNNDDKSKRSIYKGDENQADKKAKNKKKAKASSKKINSTPDTDQIDIMNNKKKKKKKKENKKKKKI